MGLDFATSYDTTRCLYRGLVVYGAVEAYRRYNVSKDARRGFQHLENQLWKLSNTFVHLTHKTRYFYTVMIASSI